MTTLRCIGRAALPLLAAALMACTTTVSPILEDSSPGDASPPCHTRADCPNTTGWFCLYDHPGCDAVGTCLHALNGQYGCRIDGGWFCNCAGQTVGSVNSCGSSPEAFVARGTCEAVDASAGE